MHGARKFARDYIAPLMVPGKRILDVACGDKWVCSEFNLGLKDYYGVDVKLNYDLREDTWWNHDFCRSYGADVFLSIYGICTLLGEEARVWTMLRRIAKPTTKFVYVGRYFRSSHREMGRQDPINGYNRASIEGLSMASGWRVVDFKTAEYDGESLKLCPPDYDSLMDVNPNAFAATMEPI